VLPGLHKRRRGSAQHDALKRTLAAWKYFDQVHASNAIARLRGDEKVAFTETNQAALERQGTCRTVEYAL
jgi:hypothetical protein